MIEAVIGIVLVGVVLRRKTRARLRNLVVVPVVQVVRVDDSAHSRRSPFADDERGF